VAFEKLSLTFPLLFGQLSLRALRFAAIVPGDKEDTATVWCGEKTGWPAIIEHALT